MLLVKKIIYRSMFDSDLIKFNSFLLVGSLNINEITYKKIFEFFKTNIYYFKFYRKIFSQFKILWKGPIYLVFFSDTELFSKYYNILLNNNFIIFGLNLKKYLLNFLNLKNLINILNLNKFFKLVLKLINLFDFILKV
jgi:hypothetical protein